MLKTVWYSFFIPPVILTTLPSENSLRSVVADYGTWNISYLLYLQSVRCSAMNRRGHRDKKIYVPKYTRKIYLVPGTLVYFFIPYIFCAPLFSLPHASGNSVSGSRTYSSSSRLFSPLPTAARALPGIILSREGFSTSSLVDSGT